MKVTMLLVLISWFAEGIQHKIIYRLDFHKKIMYRHNFIGKNQAYLHLKYYSKIFIGVRVKHQLLTRSFNTTSKIVTNFFIQISLFATDGNSIVVRLLIINFRKITTDFQVSSLQLPSTKRQYSVTCLFHYKIHEL